VSYTIVRTNGSVLTEIPDGVVNTTSTPLSLPGRNYSSYGVVMDTNFVHALENFADGNVPNNAIRGQLFFNTNTETLYICPTDGESNLSNWLKIISSNDDNLEFGNITLTGNIYANNAVMTNDVIGNRLIGNYLTVYISANVNDATLTGSSNIANIRTNNITTGSNITSGNLTGNWNLNGNVSVPSGNVSASGVKSDNYMYANGVSINFLQAAGLNGYIQFNTSGNLNASAGLTFDTATSNLNLLGNLGAGGDITASGNLSGPAANITNIPAANLQGTINSTVQANITQLGTLTSATVLGTIYSGNLIASLNVSAASLTGSLTTAAQPNITSVGTLTGLAVSGTINSGNLTGANLISGNFISGTLTTAAQPNITSVGTLSSLNVNANITSGNVYANSGRIGASLLSGTLTTTAQPNITSLGTLSSVTVTGNIDSGNVNSNFSGDGSRLTNIPGANVTGTVSSATTAISATSATTAGTVTTAAQPNITSLGALASLIVNGNVNSGNVISNFEGDGSKLTNLPGANVTGKVPNAIYADIAGTAGPADTANTVILAAQPNITSVGTLISLNVTGNINGANLTGKHFGNGAPLSNITGANVNGQVPNALVAGTVYTNAQPNITSTGTLISLNVTGNINANNFVASNYFVGNGSKLTNINAANIVGNVPNANFATTAGYAANAGNALNADTANYANSAGSFGGVNDIAHGGTSGNTVLAAGTNLGIIGVGQTWQNLTGSRTRNTSYRNTTGRPIQVIVQTEFESDGDDWFDVSSDSTTWITLGMLSGGTAYGTNEGGPAISAIIPAGHYYRWRASDADVNLLYWSELR
jgi:hypothetical protein